MTPKDCAPEDNDVAINIMLYEKRIKKYGKQLYA